MKVGLQAWGSEGDIRPMLALALRLCRAGHSVRLDVTPVDGKDYRSFQGVENLRLRMVPEQLAFSLSRVAAQSDRLDPLKVSREMVNEAFFPYLDQLYAAALELCAQSDVVVWHYASWYTRAAALKTGVPDATLQLFPGLAPSRHRPPAGLPSLGPLNPALWWLARLALDLQFRKRPAAFFEAHGLPRLRHVMPQLLFSPRLNLHAMSPLLCPPPADWGPEHVVCGQLTLPEADERWEPSPALRAFLECGPPPVLFSLGSMEHFAPKRARELFVGAARAAGMRAIIQTKRSGEEGQDGALYFLPWAAHAALLPRCAAMVHHGGAGTTHAALRAGLPSVVVPVILEQQLWGDLVHRAGAATRPLGFWKATDEQLAAKLRELTATSALAERARELAASLSVEDGTGHAVRLLEQLPSSR